MNAFAIKRIPNVEHTQRVLDTRRALRLVPPCEGVWPASVDRSGAAGETREAGLDPKDESAVGEAETPNA